MSDNNNVENIKDTDTNEKEKFSFKALLKELIVYAIIIVLCITVVPKYVMQRSVVKGDSMETTLQENDSLFVQKVTRYFTNPDRYDIIVLHPDDTQIDSPDEDPKEVFYVKRIYGLPGETIQIVGNDILINGEKIDDPYESNVMVKGDEGTAKEPITLKDNEFFVLGDNRAVSLDSREMGPIRKDQIQGTVLFRLWPIHKFGSVEKK